MQIIRKRWNALSQFCGRFSSIAKQQRWHVGREYYAILLKASKLLCQDWLGIRIKRETKRLTFRHLFRAFSPILSSSSFLYIQEWSCVLNGWIWSILRSYVQPVWLKDAPFWFRDNSDVCRCCSRCCCCCTTTYKTVNTHQTIWNDNWLTAAVHCLHSYIRLVSDGKSLWYMWLCRVINPSECVCMEFVFDIVWNLYTSSDLYLMFKLERERVSEWYLLVFFFVTLSMQLYTLPHIVCLNPWIHDFSICYRV